MKLPLIYYGSPLLRKKCEPIHEITDEIRQLALDMVDTMDAHNGIGLAAPQVGKLVRMIVLRNYIHHPDGKIGLSAPDVYINPKISHPSKETITEPEGCLSIPGIRLDVERPLRIHVEATNLEGKHFVEDVEGYKSRVILHENDHINGVLFFDRALPADRKEAEPILRRIKKKYNK